MPAAAKRRLSPILSAIRRAQTVWYQLDHTDADPFVFLGYISHGIKNFAPDFGETIFPYLTEANDELLRFPERAVDLLLNEILNTIEQPFILVLDDYHHIGRETIVHQLVDRLLQYSSDMLHIDNHDARFAAARDYAPPLAIRRAGHHARRFAFYRRRSARAFPANFECRAERRGNRRISQAHARLDYGFAARPAGRRAARFIRSRTLRRRIDLHEILQQSEKDIFDYFAEEVFSREPEDMQNLLLHLSLLESLPLDVCSRLFPDMRCSADSAGTGAEKRFSDGRRRRQNRRGISASPAFPRFSAAPPARGNRARRGRRGKKPHRRVFSRETINGKKPCRIFCSKPKISSGRRRSSPKTAANGWRAARLRRSSIFAEKIPLEFLEKFPRALASQSRNRAPAGRNRKIFKSFAAAPSNCFTTKKTRSAKPKHCIRWRAWRGAKANAAKLSNFWKKPKNWLTKIRKRILKCANTRGLCLIAQGAWTNAEQQFRLALELAEKQSQRALHSPDHAQSGFAFRLSRRFRRGAALVQANFSRRPARHAAAAGSNRAFECRAAASLSRRIRRNRNASGTGSLELCQLYNLKPLRGEIFEAYGNFYRDKQRFHARRRILRAGAKSLRRSGSKSRHARVGRGTREILPAAR